MHSKENIKAEINLLCRELAVNGMNLNMQRRRQNLDEVINLMCARTEILKSIAHRQGLLIEILENESRYSEAA